MMAYIPSKRQEKTNQPHSATSQNLWFLNTTGLQLITFFSAVLFPMGTVSGLPHDSPCSLQLSITSCTVDQLNGCAGAWRQGREIRVNRSCYQTGIACSLSRARFKLRSMAGNTPHS